MSCEGGYDGVVLCSCGYSAPKEAIELPPADRSEQELMLIWSSSLRPLLSGSCGRPAPEWGLAIAGALVALGLGSTAVQGGKSLATTLSVVQLVSFAAMLFLGARFASRFGWRGVVIVDEASQAGLEAAFLQYLSPRIVVVGDDKQVSPAGVGIDHQSLIDLRHHYLRNVAHPETWEDPRASFFDQAKLRYGDVITLRELV